MKQYLDYESKTPSRWQHVTVSSQSVSESFIQPIHSKRMIHSWTTWLYLGHWIIESRKPFLVPAQRDLC